MIARMTDAGDNAFNFNTVISKTMELLNIYEKLKPDPKTDDERRALREVAEGVTRIIAPLAPFLGEAFWKMLGGEGSVFRSGWPVYDEEATRVDEMELPVQINGKVRAKITVATGLSDEDLKKTALDLPILAGKKVIRVIVVKGRLVNVVVKKD